MIQIKEWTRMKNKKTVRELVLNLREMGINASLCKPRTMILKKEKALGTTYLNQKVIQSQ